MNAGNRYAIAMLAAAFAASGCVSTGEFEKMQAAKNEEIQSLKQQNTALQDQKNTLEKEKAALEQQNSSMQQQNIAMQQQQGDLQQQNVNMQQQVGSLESQKAALIEASRQRQQQYDSLVQNLSKEVEKGQLQVRQYQNMLAVDLAEQIFFDSGKATLKPGGKEVLKKVAEALKGDENKLIRVVGHTDNMPIARGLQDTFPTNWELSVARATTVVRFLQDAGIPPQRLLASGKGEYDPIASNDTPEGRQKNRRIEIMLIDQSLADEVRKSVN